MQGEAFRVEEREEAFLFFLFFWPNHAACRILVLNQGSDLRHCIESAAYCFAGLQKSWFPFLQFYLFFFERWASFTTWIGLLL